MADKMKIGWVGVGKMGLPMAGHLLAAGHAITACDIAHAGVAALVARGAHKAASPAEAARGNDVIFSSILLISKFKVSYSISIKTGTRLF